MKWLMLAVLLVHGCADFDDNEHICKERGERRACSREEIRVIDRMQSIIRALTYDTVDKNSFVRLKHDEMPQINLFGEDHTNVIGQIETLNFINSKARNKQVILLEGFDKKYFLDQNCGMFLIQEILLTWEWVRLGKPYDENYREDILQRQNYFRIFESTKESYDISHLKISNSICGFWDDIEAWSLPVTYTTLKKRNAGVPVAIEFWRQISPNIDAILGLGHLPMGEYIYQTARLGDLPKDFPSYYKHIKTLRKRSPVHASNLGIEAGTTKPIFEYFYRKNIPHGEYIHGSAIR